MPKLTGKKPEFKTERTKVMLYGKYKSGKTTTALWFPKAYYIDTEFGAEKKKYVEELKKSDATYLATDDYDEILDNVIALYSQPHDYKTLVIDSITKVYNILSDKCADDLMIKGKGTKDETYTGTDYAKHQVIPKRKMRRLYQWLEKIDMNVVVISREKIDYKTVGGSLVDNGPTFDCYDGTGYTFDVMLHLSKRGDSRWARVTGSRLDGFKENDNFELQRESFLDRLNKEGLEKVVTPIVLATPEQVVEVTHLIKLLQIPEEVTDKWLTKSKAENWNEMPTEAIQKCIDHLKNKINQLKESSDV